MGTQVATIKRESLHTGFGAARGCNNVVTSQLRNEYIIKHEDTVHCLITVPILLV